MPYSNEQFAALVGHRAHSLYLLRNRPDYLALRPGARRELVRSIAGIQSRLEIAGPRRAWT